MYLRNLKITNSLRKYAFNKIKNVQFLSSQNLTNSSLVEEPEKSKEDILKTNARRKLRARQPLVKNFFVGNVDKELLAFPEVISRDEMSELQVDIDSIKHCFEKNGWNSQSEIEINQKCLDALINSGLLGLNIPRSYNGKEYCWSESLMASETEINITDIAQFLLPHRIVCDVINIHGSEAQKQKYLTSFANGSLKGADAVLEPNNTDNNFFSTIADLDRGTEIWTLKGTKSILASGSKPDVLLVLAETDKLDSAGNNSKGVTCFIVETEQSGVIFGEIQNTVGHITVEFENVQLNNENIIGNVNEGTLIANLLLQNSRLRASYIGFGLMRNMINRAAQYIIETKYCGVPLMDVESVTTCLSKIVCNAYASESMIYFTAGLMDEFDNQDIEIESAIVKLYTLNSLWESVISLIDFLGPKYLLPDQQGNSDIQDITQLCTQVESSDSLRIFIALAGLKHAGMSIHDLINKQRNPLFNPGHILKKFFQSSSVEIPNTKMFLNQELHPSLEPAAQNLEHSIYRLQICTELLLTRYGNEIVNHHSEIKRLAEMATLIYASFASMARASRSYCIGLRLGDHEMLLASAIALNARNRIKELSLEIQNGPYVTNDKNYERITKQMLKTKGYFVENPLKFNY